MLIITIFNANFMRCVLILGVFTLILCSFLHFYANLFRQNMFGAYINAFSIRNGTNLWAACNFCILPTALQEIIQISPPGWKPHN